MSENNLRRLCDQIDPARTVLFFGAGASRSSGAPLAAELARELENEVAQGERIADDLAELCSILEYRYGRTRLVEKVVERLQQLEPDEALVALARYPWPSLYTTNYDQLVEKAYAKAGLPLAVIRSHFDWEQAHQPGTTALYKVHGCISEDRAFRQRSSMILTVEDYGTYGTYRQMLFGRLQLELSGGAVVILGYSLRDPHIQSLVQEALRLKREAAAPGRIHVIVHELDADRAAVWRARGLESVAEGDLNRFVHELVQAKNPASRTITGPAAVAGVPHRLAASTIVLGQQRQKANPQRLFFGGAATYGDVASGFTFERDAEYTTDPASRLATVILGAAGTGKSTLARRLLSKWQENGRFAFEHRSEFPFDAQAWLTFEQQIRDAGAVATLLIDNCIPFQRQINELVRGLPKDGALHIVLTAETSAWRIRQKEPRIFRDSKFVELSRLSVAELASLLRVVTTNAELRQLVSGDFLSRGESEQLRILERKCLADMFVCLKVLFSADTLDDIILKEFNNLISPYDTVYKVVAGLEAAGAIPHRQMVLRVSGLGLEFISSALHVLEGLVDEVERSASLGIYVWRTRHEVIAKILSTYKYSDDVELKALLSAAVQTANPSFSEEARTLRDMCISDRGIRALPNASDRVELYREIARLMPNDNVVRHRLIAELLDAENLAEAEAELARAIDDVGLDPPLQRYRVKRQILRARRPELRSEDRRAILKDGMREAEVGVSRYPDNKYMYFAAADVAEEWFHATGERGWLEWAKLQLTGAQHKLLDPDIAGRLQDLWRL